MGYCRQTEAETMIDRGNIPVSFFIQGSRTWTYEKTARLADGLPTPPQHGRRSLNTLLRLEGRHQGFAQLAVVVNDDDYEV